MPEQCALGDRTLRVGDMLVANSMAYELDVCRRGTVVTVKTIKAGGDDGPLVGLESPNKLPGWHSLDGIVRGGCGFWATRDLLLDAFNFKESGILEVVEDINYKGYDLKGMPCRLLARDRKNGLSFVELEKNIGGGCADGLGKTGHCIPVPSSAVKPKQKTKETK